eukprot:4814955-Lingulodinium_polyedra.AAC.1
MFCNCNATQRNAAHSMQLQYDANASATHCNAVQCNAVQRNGMQRNATQRKCNEMPRNAQHC